MKKKSLFAMLFFVLMISLSLSASAEEINFKEFSSNSTFTPVSYSAHKSLSSVTLYGNADYLCMKAFKDTDDYEEFRLDIYSDSKRTKKIHEYSNTYKNGTKYDDILFDLTSFKSKTYYATSYVVKKSNLVLGRYEQDPSTVTKFKIVVKRDGTEIKNMKTIMYGYENSSAGPIVYWYSVPGATKYCVYKKEDGKFKKVKTVKAGGGDISYYIDKSLKDKNATAYYKVKAVNGTGKTPLSEKVLKVNVVKTPKVTLNANQSGGIKVSWSKVSEDATYYVYMAKGDSDWEYLGDTSKRYYVCDDVMKSGTTYYFAVIAKNSKGTSGISDEKGILYFENPVIKSIEESSGNLVISWNAVKGANSYNVYKKQSGTDEWTKIGNTKACSFTDYDDVEKNTLYTYCIRSVRGSTECVYKVSTKSKAIIEVPVLNPIKANSDGCPVVSWKAIDNVSYKVYRKAEGDSNWSVIKTTKSTKFTDTNKTVTDIVNGEKYYYTVRAYIGSEYGEMNENAESFVWYMPIENAAPSPAEDGVRIDWDPIKNIDGYNIYRKKTDGEYALLGKSDTNYFKDKTIDKDVRYYYKIVGVADGEEKSASAVEIPAKVSSKYVCALTETAETQNIGSCNIKVANYNSDKKYAVYTKIDGEWIYVKGQSSQNETLTFSKNDNSYINEYAIVNIYEDGTVTSICDKNIFTLEYICSPEFSVSGNNNDYTATVTWEAVDGAEKYNVYLGGNKIATLDSSVTSYKSGKLEAGKNKYHYFSVSAVRGDVECIANAERVNLTKKPTVEAKNNSKSIRVEWEDTANGDYTVYRKTSANGKWKEIKTLYDDCFDDINVENGKTYYYMVSTANGIKSANEVKITYVKPTSISGASLGEKSINIKWKKNSAADYYIVYKYKGTKWKEVYRTEDAGTVKYTDKDVETGKKYSYKVCVVKNGSKSAGASKSVIFVSPPTGLKATAVSNGVKISFKNVEGAKKYVIYRKSGSGEYQKIKTLKSSSLSYTDKNVEKGVKYTYYVKAYNGSLLSKASSKVSYKK